MDSVSESNELPVILVSETSHISAMLGFAVLTCLLFAGFAFAIWLRKRREKSGIYRKYALPQDQSKTRARRSH